MRRFGRRSKWEAMRSLQQGDHRRLLLAISTTKASRGRLRPQTRDDPAVNFDDLGFIGGLG
jgi:hypothetical protein